MISGLTVTVTVTRTVTRKRSSFKFTGTHPGAPGRDYSGSVCSTDKPRHSEWSEGAKNKGTRRESEFGALETHGNSRLP